MPEGLSGELEAGLREWLAVCGAAEIASFVTVPSAAVAEAWRRLAAGDGYAETCRDAFGVVLPPVDVGRLDERRRAGGIARTWAVCCSREGLDQLEPRRMPGLFTLDRRIGHPGGMLWEATGDDPPVRLAAGPEPLIACAWPQSPVAALLHVRFGAGMYSAT